MLKMLKIAKSERIKKEIRITKFEKNYNYKKSEITITRSCAHALLALQPVSPSWYWCKNREQC